MAKIHEYRHDFLQRPYLKADGMPGQYSPDLLVRTADDVFVVSYVLLGEHTARDWHGKNARVSECLAYAKLRPAGTPAQEPLFDR